VGPWPERSSLAGLRGGLFDAKRGKARMSTDYQNSILWRGEDPQQKKFKPSYEPSKKSTRYFPGQVPAWAREAEAKKAEDAKKEKEELPKKNRRRDRTAAVIVSEDRGAARLRRLQASESAGDTGAERLLRHRVVHDAQVLESCDNKPDEIAKLCEGIKDKLREKLKDKLDHKEGDDGFQEFQGVKDVKELKEDSEEEEVPFEDEMPRSAKSEVKTEVKSEVKDEEAEDEDAIALKRQKMREHALSRRKEEEALLKDDLLGVEEEEESEYESESEEQDPRKSSMVKPVFVSRKGRDTIKEKENMEKEEEEAEVRRQEKVKERKVESKSLVIDVIKNEADQEAVAALGLDDNSDIELIDDDDELNEAEEYELWKIRELKRIKRDGADKIQKEKELEFIERRRQMTDEERAADDARLDAGTTFKEDSKNFAFLQKYYHRGTFFQDKATSGEEPLYLRDYHEPTEEEKFDKQSLPKSMQVRRGLFGKKGQTKHTHLTDVDTTDMSAAWSQQNKQVQKYQEKMAGASGVNNFARPQFSKGT